MAPRLTDEGLRILDYVTKGTSRPSSGAATGFVAGDWAHQARLAMTPTMMRQKAIELLRYAEEAEREKTKPVAANRYDKCVQCGETFNWKYQGVANGAGEYFCGLECHERYWRDEEAWKAL